MATSVNWQTKVSSELDEMVTELSSKMGIGKQELVRFVVSSYCQNQLMTQQHLKEGINNLILQTGEKSLEDFKQLSDDDKYLHEGDMFPTPKPIRE